MGFSFFGKKKKITEQEVKDKHETPEASSEMEMGHSPESACENSEKTVASENQNSETEKTGIDDSSHESKVSFFKRLRQGMSKTREILTTDIDELFFGKKKIDDEFFEELEALLITSDMGVETTMALMEGITQKAKKVKDSEQVKLLLKEEILSIMQGMPDPPKIQAEKPHVIMVVGVNGVGKTTTIGKLAARFEAQGKKTLIAAADTFRAAAIEQLGIWADRAGAELVKGKDKADPAAIAFDAIGASIARGIDIVLIDTAGRLHTNINLMEELKKIKRAIDKKMPGAPHEILLVLDGSTGQNAMSQANMFNEALGITGMALTKLDGTARGGIVVSICSNLKIPLQYIGIGEKIDDLQDFSVKRFVDALF